MYKIWKFDEKLCRYLRNHFDVIIDDCNIFSIWNFCPLSRLKAVKDLFTKNVFCPAQWFPLIFWLALLISLAGTIYSIIEFANLYRTNCKRISMWRQRTYYVLSYSVLKKGRLIGALLMIFVWSMLLYAIVNVSPLYMTPWLTVTMIIICIEFCSWVTEVVVGHTIPDLYTLLTIMLPFGNYLCVRCVRNVFQNAIELDEIEDVQLWSGFF